MRHIMVLDDSVEAAGLVFGYLEDVSPLIPKKVRQMMHIMVLVGGKGLSE